MAAFEREIASVAALHNAAAVHDVDLNDDRRDGDPAAEVERHRMGLKTLIDLAVKFGVLGGAAMMIAPRLIVLILRVVSF